MSFGFYPCPSMHIHKFQLLPILIKPNRQSWLPMIADPFLTYVTQITVKASNMMAITVRAISLTNPNPLVLTTANWLGYYNRNFARISPTSAGILWLLSACFNSCQQTGLLLLQPWPTTEIRQPTVNCQPGLQKIFINITFQRKFIKQKLRQKMVQEQEWIICGESLRMTHNSKFEG